MSTSSLAQHHRCSIDPPHTRSMWVMYHYRMPTSWSSTSNQQCRRMQLAAKCHQRKTGQLHSPHNCRSLRRRQHMCRRRSRMEMLAPRCPRTSSRHCRARMSSLQLQQQQRRKQPSRCMKCALQLPRSTEIPQRTERNSPPRLRNWKHNSFPKSTRTNTCKLPARTLRRRTTVPDHTPYMSQRRRCNPQTQRRSTRTHRYTCKLLGNWRPQRMNCPPDTPNQRRTTSPQGSNYQPSRYTKLQ